MKGFPGSSIGRESACQCRSHKRHGFNPWVRKVPWRRAWQPTPVFSPGEPWTEEPGGLQPTGLRRAGRDWRDWARTCRSVTSRWRLRGSRERWSFVSRGRKSSVRGKVMGQKWFIRAGCLEGLWAGERVPGRERNSEEEGKTTFFLVLSCLISSSSRLGREASCPYLVKPGLPWHYGKIISGLSAVRAFHLEMSSVHKLLLFMYPESAS